MTGGAGGGARILAPAGGGDSNAGAPIVPIPGVSSQLLPIQPNPTGLGGAGQVSPGSVLGNNTVPLMGLGPNGTIPGTYVDANGYTVQPSFNIVNGQVVVQNG